MFIHLSPKERFGYVALGAIFLAAGGFVAAQKLRRPATIELHDTTQPKVSFDHGAPRPSNRDSTRSSIPEVSSAEVIVHVAGAVNHPGLVRLRPGSRVYEAIQQAGGPTPDANLDAVNLAAKVIDGSQIYVPRMSDSATGVGSTAYAPGAGSVTAPRSSSHAKHPEGVVNINSADTTQFQTLPGIGPAMAQRIVEYRELHGPFQSVDDLGAVQGFSKKRLEQIRQWLAAN